MRATVVGPQLSLVERLESAVASNIAFITGAPIYRAVQDSLDEANEDNGQQTPYRRAEAHEAASGLALYLQQMTSDFRAIDDLTARAARIDKRTNKKPESPARFSAQQREMEEEQMRDIEFLSYVTLGKRPYRFDPARPAPLWDLAKPWTYSEVSKDNALSPGTDCTYRACYRACAGGPVRPAEREPRRSEAGESETTHRSLGQRRNRECAVHVLAAGRQRARPRGSHGYRWTVPSSARRAGWTPHLSHIRSPEIRFGLRRQDVQEDLE